MYTHTHTHTCCAVRPPASSMDTRDNILGIITVTITIMYIIEILLLQYNNVHNRVYIYIYMLRGAPPASSMEALVML